MTFNADPETSRYITAAQSTERLDREQELELFLAWRDDGDRRAADRLIRAHLRDVAFAALKYRHYGMPISDLISEGNVGLMRALEKFDPSHGTRFATYAAYWIRAYVVGHVLKSWTLVGGATGVLRTRTFFRLRRERVKVQNQHGEGPEANRVLAERMGVSVDELRKMLGRLDSRDVSLDAPARGESGRSLAATLAAEDDQEESYARGELSSTVSDALASLMPALDDRERFIVERRLLVERDDEMSLAEIGREFGVSRERARQLEARAKGKLRRGLVERCGSGIAEQFAA